MISCDHSELEVFVLCMQNGRMLLALHTITWLLAFRLKRNRHRTSHKMAVGGARWLWFDVPWIITRRVGTILDRYSFRRREAFRGGAPRGATLGRAPLRGAAPWGAGRREPSSPTRRC